MNACYLLGDAVMGMPKHSNFAPAALPSVGLHHSCCREILRLNDENARLAGELAEIRARHEDLTRSAEIWIRLYEARLALATKEGASGHAGADAIRP